MPTAKSSHDTDDLVWPGVEADRGDARSASAASDGPKTDGARTDGARTDGARTDGARTDGARTDGARTDGARTDGGRTDGAAAEADQRYGSPNWTRSPGVRLAVIGGAVAVALVAIFALGDRLIHLGSVGHNVTVNGIDVSGMSGVELHDTLSDGAKRFLDRPITISAGDLNRSPRPRDLGATIDIASAERKALAARDSWNPFTWIGSWFSSVDVPFPSVTVPSEQVKALIGPALQGAEVAPVDARFDVTGDTIQVVPSVDGKGLDVQTAVDDIVAAIVSNGDRKARIPLGAVRPKFNTDDANKLGITQKVSTFTTQFPAGQPRVKNIARIGQLVDGTIIPAGESWSANNAVGPRTPERGFVSAPVIDSGEMSEDFGGGVSQFATTTWNAAFFAGLPIEKYQSHTFWIRRYPPGRDATLWYGQADLVIKNDYKSALLMKVTVGATSITVDLWGTQDGRKVTYSSTDRVNDKAPKIECRFDGTLSVGSEKVRQSAGDGFEISVTRKIAYADGRKPDTRVFHTTYGPENKIIAYNGGGVAAPAPGVPGGQTQVAGGSTANCPASNNRQLPLQSPGVTATTAPPTGR